MVQAGDPKSRDSSLRKPRRAPDSAYTIPAEIREDPFHRRGILAAARMGDNVNPARASSGTQFYIVQGRTFTDISLDSVETFRLNGRKIPPERRENYKKQGGAPHLDQAYTIFGEVIDGMETVDRIAAVNTTGRTGNDRPLEPIRILKTRLVKRKT
jgi:peptidyl-prolyl cis-trans isomerase B (cyclophilin B)